MSRGWCSVCRRDADYCQCERRGDLGEELQRERRAEDAACARAWAEWEAERWARLSPEERQDEEDRAADRELELGRGRAAETMQRVIDFEIDMKETR